MNRGTREPVNSAPVGAAPLAAPSGAPEETNATGLIASPETVAEIHQRVDAVAERLDEFDLDVYDAYDSKPHSSPPGDTLTLTAFQRRLNGTGVYFTPNGDCFGDRVTAASTKDIRVVCKAVDDWLDALSFLDTAEHPGWLRRTLERRERCIKPTEGAA